MTRLASETSLYAEVFDEHGRLRVSVPCVRCGYDLRTQPRDARCPECGHAVRQTLPHVSRDLPGPPRGQPPDGARSASDG